MKKLFIACLALAGFCSLGQVAKADPYCDGGYYRGGCYGHRHVDRGGYVHAPYCGPRRVFVNTYFCAPPIAVYRCYPPPRPQYYEGLVVPPRPEYREPAPGYGYSK